jgi:hypothetical protein
MCFEVFIILLLTFNKTTLVKAWSSPEIARRFKLPNFKTIDILKLKDCQPYAPAAFNPPKIFLVLISVRGRDDPRTTV